MHCMNDTVEPSFYRTPLGACILAGDISGVMDAVDAMSPSQQKEALAGVQALMSERWKLLQKRTEDGNWVRVLAPEHANRLFRAVELAHFMCEPDHVMADYWKHIGIQDIALFKQRYQPERSVQPL
jgi:hypothetical protein